MKNKIMRAKAKKETKKDKKVDKKGNTSDK